MKMIETKSENVYNGNWDNRPQAPLPAPHVRPRNMMGHATGGVRSEGLTDKATFG